MSQLAGQTPFVQVPISQKLPDQMSYKDALETASVVSGRQHGVRYSATNGGPYSIGSGQAEIVIPLSSDYYLDLQTACLEYEVKCEGNLTSAETGNPVLESGPLAPFSELILEVGGVQVSRIRDPNSVYNAYAYMGQIQSHDNSEGTLENSWATSQKATVVNDANETLTDKIASLQDATTITSLMDADQQAVKGVYKTSAKNGVGAGDEDTSYRNASRNGIKLVCVPLSKILGFFSQEAYFPLRNVGNITLRLRTHSRVESCVVSRQAALVANAGVVLNDVHVKADAVVPESAYLAAMDQLIGSASGLQMAFQDTEVQVRDFDGNTSIGEYNLNFIVGARYLTRAAFLFRHRASLNSASHCSTFSFQNPGFQQARLQLGSMSVPTANPIRSIEDAYYTLLKSNNMQGNPDYGNAISLKDYCADISRTGTSASKVIASSKFILAFSLEQVLQANQDLLQGLNTLQNNSNVQLVIDARGTYTPDGTSGGATDSGLVATGIFNMQKVISLKMNAVSVEAK